MKGRTPQTDPALPRPLLTPPEPAALYRQLLSRQMLSSHRVCIWQNGTLLQLSLLAFTLTDRLIFIYHEGPSNRLISGSVGNFVNCVRQHVKC